MKKYFLCLGFCFYSAFLSAQFVSTARQIRFVRNNKEVKIGTNIQEKDELQFGKGGILVVYKKKDGIFVMRDMDGKKANLSQAVRANSINMIGLRNTEQPFMNYEEIRDYFSVSKDKTKPENLLIMDEGVFEVADKKYLVNAETNYFLLPDGVKNIENGIKLIKKGSAFIINSEILQKNNLDTSQATFFKLIYQNANKDSIWITDCKLIFAQKTEIKEILKAIVENIKNENATEIEKICIENINAVYGMPNTFLIRKMLIDLGLKF